MPRPFVAALCATLLTLLVLPPTPAPAAQPPAFNNDIPAPPTPGAPVAPPEPVPPAPAGFVLDQAHVLLPEAAARLSARLTAASASDVRVYVVTVTSLHVQASKQSERLQERAREYANAWLSGKAGAIVLFDDEGGLLTLELTKETDRRFTNFAVEAKVKNAMDVTHQSGLARDKLELTANVVAATLTRYQADYDKATQRQRTANLIMGGVALLGLALALYSALTKPKAQADMSGQPTMESKPPTADV